MLPARGTHRPYAATAASIFVSDPSHAIFAFKSESCYIEPHTLDKNLFIFLHESVGELHKIKHCFILVFVLLGGGFVRGFRD